MWDPKRRRRPLLLQGVESGGGYSPRCRLTGAEMGLVGDNAIANQVFSKSSWGLQRRWELELRDPGLIRVGAAAFSS